MSDRLLEFARDDDYHALLAEWRLPVEAQAEPAKNASKRLLARNLGLTASRMVYEVMADRMLAPLGHTADLQRAKNERDEALAEVAKLKAKVARWEMSYELATGALGPLAPLAKMVVQGFFVECMPERAGGGDE